MSRELSGEFTERLNEAGRPRVATLRETDPNAAHNLLRAIFDSSTDGMLLLDSTGIILSSNNAFAALLGARSSDLVGGHWLSFCLQTLPAFPCELIYASLSDGKPRSERVRLPGPDGNDLSFELRATPLSLDGRPLGRLIVQAQNSTALMRLEEQLTEAERFTSSRRLAAAVAHEIKTPLQAIESCLHLAGKIDDAAQRSRYLRLARDEIQRVSQIMQQLLDLYRPNDAASAAFALNDLVERALLLVGSNLSGQAIQVKRDLAPDLPRIVGRADELTQVLLNLLLNAIQAMPRGGLLSIRTRHDPVAEPRPCVTLAIGDNGLGIAPIDLERIFEPFFTTRPDGNGLGLAISRRIIVAHGGTLEVQSDQAKGTTFYVSLPLPEAGT